jgi:methylenetetrahydrofolate reductase (NADPH)
MESQKRHKQTFSFELFPPKTNEGMAKLQLTVRKLAEVDPLYFSVTYGAGGSTRDRTFETVDWLRSEGLETAPHLSCIGLHKNEILKLLQRYQNDNISRLVALRGDMPSGMGDTGDLLYANELVEFIRAETGDHFHLEVAAYPEFHPQAPSAGSDLENFKRKVDAGANSAITQYFFNADSYFNFIDSCEKLGIDIPIVPGIMPINNYAQLARFSDACGAEIPRWLRKRLEEFDDDLDGIRNFGLDVVTEMCERLLDQGAPGLHFYTMNQAELTLALWNNLNLSSRA